jgi:hypothetical protein
VPHRPDNSVPQTRALRTWSEPQLAFDWHALDTDHKTQLTTVASGEAYRPAHRYPDSQIPLIGYESKQWSAHAADVRRALT